MRQHSQRGQALIETFIALPLALLAIFTLFWTAKFAILSERLESDTRYAQQVLDSSNIYTEYSLASLYDATSGKPKFLINCQTPPPELISSTSVATINTIQFPRNALWSGTNVSPSCSIDHQGLLSNGKFSRDLLIGFQRSAIATQFSPSFGSKMLFPNGPGSLPLRSQSMSMFIAASIADLEICFPSAFNAISASLARGDQTGSNEFLATTTTIHALPPTTKVALNANCIGTPPKNAGPAKAVASPGPGNSTPPNGSESGGTGLGNNGSNAANGNGQNGSQQPTPQPGASNSTTTNTNNSGTNSNSSGSSTGGGTSSQTGSGNGTPQPGTKGTPPAGNSNPGGSQTGPGGAPYPDTTTHPAIPVPVITNPAINNPPGGTTTLPNATPIPVKTIVTGGPPNTKPTSTVSQPTATKQPSGGASPAPARTATPPPSSGSNSSTTPAPGHQTTPAPAHTAAPTPKPAPAATPISNSPGGTFG